MALTAFQSEILRLLAANREANQESYVAGGLALNYRLKAPRISRDIDVFHDSRDALFQSWFSDKSTLETNGFQVKPLRELQTFVEAEISKGGSRTEIQWGGVYKAAELCSFWHAEVERARRTVELIPRDEAGKVVMTKDGDLFKGSDEEFTSALAAGDIVFHEGHIGGAWPRIIA